MTIPADGTPAAEPPQARIVVIGMGNDYRGDDAAGLAAARRLREHHLPGVTILETGGDAATLLAIWQGADAVIVIDAVSSGAAPGNIVRCAAHAAPLPQRLFAPHSSHAWGLAQAIELARALGELPPHLIVYGIEGESFAARRGLSPPVAQAVEVVVARVLGELGPDGGPR